MATSATPGDSLHEHALNAERELEQLATGLGQVGASPDTIKTVTQMADVTRQIVSALGAGQENSGDEEPPTEAQPENYDQAAAQTQEMMQASAAKE